MWLLIAEMVLALSLIVFIMVWTLRARVDHQADDTEANMNKPEVANAEFTHTELTKADIAEEKITEAGSSNGKD